MSTGTVSILVRALYLVSLSVNEHMSTGTVSILVRALYLVSMSVNEHMSTGTVKGILLGKYVVIWEKELSFRSVSLVQKALEY